MSKGLETNTPDYAELVAKLQGMSQGVWPYKACIDAITHLVAQVAALTHDIEAKDMNLDQCYGTIAASQAREAKLREALEKHSAPYLGHGDFGKRYRVEDQMVTALKDAFYSFEGQLSTAAAFGALEIAKSDLIKEVLA